MCDEMERAQLETERFLERALAVHHASRRKQTGRPLCYDCEEPISALRQELGATLCIECARDMELRRRQYREDARVMA